MGLHVTLGTGRCGTSYTCYSGSYCCKLEGCKGEGRGHQGTGNEIVRQRVFDFWAIENKLWVQSFAFIGHKA